MMKNISAQNADALGPIEYKISTLQLYFAVEHNTVEENSINEKKKKKTTQRFWKRKHYHANWQMFKIYVHLKTYFLNTSNL